MDVRYRPLCSFYDSYFFRGITEYLFRNPAMLEEAIQAALYRKEIRSDDMEFVTCARGWAETVSLVSMEGYQKRF